MEPRISMRSWEILSGHSTLSSSGVPPLTPHRGWDTFLTKAAVGNRGFCTPLTTGDVFRHDMACRLRCSTSKLNPRSWPNSHRTVPLFRKRLQRSTRSLRTPDRSPPHVAPPHQGWRSDGVVKCCRHPLARSVLRTSMLTYGLMSSLALGRKRILV